MSDRFMIFLKRKPKYNKKYLKGREIYIKKIYIMGRSPVKQEK